MPSDARLNATKRIELIFYRSPSGREPVREWLRELSLADCKIVGNDLQTVEFGWPIGIPLCAQMTGSPGLWECRSTLSSRRIARVLFMVSHRQLIALHGFIKKTRHTPRKDIQLARHRMKEEQRHA